MIYFQLLWIVIAGSIDGHIIDTQSWNFEIPRIISAVVFGVFLLGALSILTLVMPLVVVVLIWRSHRSVTEELLLTAIQAAIAFGAFIAFLPLVQ